MTLLLVHIWLPAKILGYLGLIGWIPLFRLRVWHLCLPQLLIPLELLVFHLCMLSFLEKGKNCIGRVQHKWLVRISTWLGLTDYLLPKTIDKFVYVGSRPVVMGSFTSVNGKKNDHQLATLEASAASCSEKEENRNACESRKEAIDVFWKELEKMSHPSDSFIRLNLASVVTPGEPPTYERGVTKRSGQRHLKSSERYICLPDSDKTKLSTSIGPYRLRRRAKGQSDAITPITDVTVIEFWREVPGLLIPRPPEGWDDLREDGAKAGRWAWGEELRSPIEEGIAHRSAFMHSDKKILLWTKIFLLLVMSWAATLIILCTLMNLPIFMGRAFFSILSLPEKYHHDPVNFAVGVFMFLPILINKESLLGVFKNGHPAEYIKSWIARFRRPASMAKTRVLVLSLLIWIFLAPLSLGLSYHLNISKDSLWWGEKHLITPGDLLHAWIVGTLLMNLWATICYLDVFRRNILFELGLDLNGRGANRNFERINEDLVGGGREWQGKEGRISLFVKNIYEILLNWEWEKIDHIVLLEECTLPILRTLFICFTIPAVLEKLVALIYGCVSDFDGRRGMAPVTIIPKCATCFIVSVDNYFSLVFSSISSTLRYH
jgi:E3 ubiquitin-protein ligase MARCH6